MNTLSQLLRHKLFRSSALVFSGSMIGNVLAWLYHLFIGRILGPEKYAEFAALFALFYIFSVPTQSLQLILVKFFSVLKARSALGQSKYLFISISKKLLVLEVVGLVLLLPLIPLLSSFLHIPSFLTFILLYLLFASSLLPTVNISALQAYQCFFELTVYSNIGSILRLISGVFVAALGVEWILMSNIFSNILSYVSYFYPLGFVFAARSKKLDISKKQFVSYSVPTVLTMFFVTLLFSQDILIVKHFFSSGVAGIYAALSILGKVIFYASSAIGAVIFSVIAEKKELKQKYSYEVYLSTVLVGGLSAILTTIYFVAPWIVLIPFGKAFAGALPYLGIFGIFITFFSLSSMLINILLASGHTKVWIIVLLASLFQAIGIAFIHSTLHAVIYVNIAVSILMYLSMVGYYVYGQRKI